MERQIVEAFTNSASGPATLAARHGVSETFVQTVLRHHKVTMRDKTKPPSRRYQQQPQQYVGHSPHGLPGTPERAAFEDKIVKYTEEGRSQKNIAAELGIDRKTVGRVLGDREITRVRKGASRREVAQSW